MQLDSLLWKPTNASSRTTNRYQPCTTLQTVVRTISARGRDDDQERLACSSDENVFRIAASLRPISSAWTSVSHVRCHSVKLLLH